MGTTIKDIARDTNLSLATISKYLNGKKILPENQKLIEESIERLGYIPNKQAQMLRSRRTNTICILLPVISDYFWGSICSYVEEYMQRHNYSTIISTYDPSSQDQSEVYRHLVSAQVEGVIIVSLDLQRSNLFTLLKSNNIPYIYLDQVMTEPAGDSVTSDNCYSAYCTTKYLLERGHRRVGVIGGDIDSYTTIERIRGFRSACREFSIPEQDQIVMCGDFTAETSGKLFKKLMSQQNPPTAVFLLGYFMTVSAIQQLDNLSIRIPEDLSLISFDDDEIFSAFDPPISVVVQDLAQMGTEASRLLLKRIQGDYSDFPRTKIIKTHFIERSSVRDLSK